MVKIICDRYLTDALPGRRKKGQICVFFSEIGILSRISRARH